jgi:DNA-binding NtrC family response regulator
MAAGCGRLEFPPMTGDMAAGELREYEAIVADDDAGIRELLVDFLTERGVRVASAVDGRAAIAALERAAGECRLVFTDIAMPGADGFAVLAAARRTNPRAHVVMVTGYGSLESAVRAVKLGAQDYLTKPFSLQQVELILQQADARWAAATREKEIASLNDALGPIHDRLLAIEELLRDLHSRFASIAPGDFPR